MSANSEMISSSSNHPVVSTLHSDSYAIGIAVLGYSICSTNISAWLILPYLEEFVCKNVLCMVCMLQVGNLTLLYSSPESPHCIMAKAYTLDSDQYTKLNIWTVNQLGIESLVYLDANTLILWNFEELFELGSVLLQFWMDEENLDCALYT